MKLFVEQRAVLQSMLEEWYENIQTFTKRADGIFSEKGKLYDIESPVWERIRFPHGFVQELRKKTDRLNQLLATYDENGTNGAWVAWSEVDEELIDIMNYSRMLGALVAMHKRRQAITIPALLESMVENIRAWIKGGGK